MILTVYGATAYRGPPRRPWDGYNDVALYRAVTDRVAAGQSYYAAAEGEQRRMGYPTAPGQVFREPTLTWLLAALKTDALRKAALVGLLVVTLTAALRALEREGVGFFARLGVMLALASGGAFAVFGQMYLIHEAWAGLLIALSLALYTPRRWGAPLAFGVAACLVRELALPYLLAMAAVALMERRWREVAGWAAGVLAFAVPYSLHLQRAASLHQPGDAVSAGWLAFGGIPYLVQMARWNLALMFAPSPLVTFAIGASVVGLLGARSTLAARCALVAGGYMAAFLAAGRADNAYWGLLYTPILALGLALCLPAMGDLLRVAFHGPHIAPVDGQPLA